MRLWTVKTEDDRVSPEQTGLSAYQNVDRRSSEWRGSDSAGSSRKIEVVRLVDSDYNSIMEKASISKATSNICEGSYN